MKILLITLSLILAVGSMAQADTCGSVDEAISTTREMLRQTIISKSKKGQLTEQKAAQILSALISYKLETARLNDEERAALQEELEGVCSVL